MRCCSERRTPRSISRIGHARNAAVSCSQMLRLRCLRREAESASLRLRRSEPLPRGRFPAHTVWTASGRAEAALFVHRRARRRTPVAAARPRQRLDVAISIACSTAWSRAHGGAGASCGHSAESRSAPALTEGAERLQRGAWASFGTTILVIWSNGQPLSSAPSCAAADEPINDGAESTAARPGARPLNPSAWRGRRYLPGAAGIALAVGAIMELPPPPFPGFDARDRAYC